MSLIDQLPSLLWGAGGGLSTYGALWAKSRNSRERAAQDLFDKIMAGVREENKDLRAEVAACKARDARMLVIDNCFRLIMPEILAIDPSNHVLVYVSNMLRSIPVEPNGGEWADWIDRIDAADEASRAKR